MPKEMTVAITAPGGMGSAVGGLLTRNGATVRTSLLGRSAASAERAKKNGMEIAETDDELVEGADFLLSILPPGDAVAIAERLSGPLSRAKKKPIYVDCNAVSPATTKRVAEVIAKTGAAFIDGGIIGPPPKLESVKTTYFFVSGPDSPSFDKLIDFGVTVRRLEGPVGAASAMKMAYGGISKGTLAIGAAMVLGADRYGTTDVLQEQIAASSPLMSKILTNGLPPMFSKAYRFVAEMEELAQFLEGIPGASEMYLGAAKLYEHLGRVYGVNNAAEGAEFDALKRFTEVKVKA